MFEINSPILVSARMMVNVAVHIFVGMVVYQTIYLALVSLQSTTETLNEFQLHIVFSVLGYQLLLVEAVMVFSEETPYSSSLSQQHKRILHMSIVTLGGALAVVGSALGLISNGVHFKSLHGICGITAMLFSIISILNGIIAYCSPKLRDRLKPATIKTVHTICGSFAVFFGLVALCTGFNMGFVKDSIGFKTTITVSVFISLILIYVLIKPLIRIKTYILQ